MFHMPLLKVMFAWYKVDVFPVHPHKVFEDVRGLPKHVIACINELPIKLCSETAEQLHFILRGAVEEAVSQSPDAVRNAKAELDDAIDACQFKVLDLQLPESVPFQTQNLSNIEMNSDILIRQSKRNDVVYSMSSLQGFHSGERGAPVPVMNACVHGLARKRELVLSGGRDTLEERFRAQVAEDVQYIPPGALDDALLVAVRSYRDIVQQRPKAKMSEVVRESVQTALDVFDVRFDMRNGARTLLTTFRIVVGGREEWLPCKISTTDRPWTFVCFDTCDDPKVRQRTAAGWRAVDPEDGAASRYATIVLAASFSHTSSSSHRRSRSTSPARRTRIQSTPAFWPWACWPTKCSARAFRANSRDTKNCVTRSTSATSCGALHRVMTECVADLAFETG